MSTISSGGTAGRTVSTTEIVCHFDKSPEKVVYRDPDDAQQDGVPHSRVRFTLISDVRLDDELVTLVDFFFVLMPEYRDGFRV